MAELQPFQPTAEARLRWQFSAGRTDKDAHTAFVPAVVGNSVYVAAADGGLARVEDGVASWRIQTGQALSAGVGSDGRRVVVATPKGEVLAYAAADGQLLWRAEASSEVLAPPAVSEQGVVVRSGDHRVHLFDAQSGKRKWTYQRATPALALRNFAPPDIAENFAFVGFPGGKLVALDLANGAPVWEGTVALPRGATELDRVADIVTAPAIDGRQVCAVAYQGRVACFDLGQGGALTWARDLSSAQGLALDGRYLFITDDKGALHALDRLTGASLWKQDKLMTRRPSGPVVRRGLVVVADVEGVVHFLSREDGAFAARLRLDGGAVPLPPQVVGSAFLFQSANGAVAAIEVQ